MILYLLVALLATLIGAIAGLGGGVIIKPMLDLIGDYDIVTISILSSITVLSMALVSTIARIKDGFKIRDTLVTITVGSVFGGVLGSLLFSLVRRYASNDTVTIIQSVILIALMIFCYFYNYQPKYKVKSKSIKFLVGMFLGMVSSFLGIGGGPVNVAVLFVMLGLNTKNAVKASIFIILFSQISGLITKTATGLIMQAQNYSMLIVMIPAAIIGGILGSKISYKISNRSIRYIYKSVVIAVICICIYNIVTMI